MDREGKTPAVSVIMPVYNAAEFLNESLGSLSAQTFEDFEIICVDDGSSDASLSILREYAEKQDRFTVLQQDHAYAGAARNLGLSRARGKYLLFLDADDRFLPKMLETAFGEAEKTNADICVFGAEAFDHRSGKTFPLTGACSPGTKQQGVFSRLDDPEHIFSFTHPAPWNKLFRRAFILENGLEFQNTRSVNDLAFVLTALAAAERITAVSVPLLQYRKNNSSSLQGSQQKEPAAFYEALREFRRRLSERGLLEPLKKAFINQAASDTFYNLSTLRQTVPFEKTYFFIRDVVLDEMELTGHPDDFFYVLPDWKIPERIRTMQGKSILDYVVRFKADLPELRQEYLENSSFKEDAKRILARFRTDQR